MQNTIYLVRTFPPAEREGVLAGREVLGDIVPAGRIVLLAERIVLLDERILLEVRTVEEVRVGDAFVDAGRTEVEVAERVAVFVLFTLTGCDS